MMVFAHFTSALSVVEMDMCEITDTALRVLEKRYFQPGEHHWHELVYRVATHFATNRDEEKAFIHMITEMDALPNSPTLMNAGTETTSYSDSFVLPIEDSIESIFKYYSDAGLISKSGGGVGVNFSAIRERGATVGSTGGVASGPINFMKGQDAITQVIKQGGKRRGANMGILDCDHPDVMDMVQAKDTPGVLENFNLSVRVTDGFMRNVTTGESHINMLNTESKKSKCLGDRELWAKIVQRTWSGGEPGILFGDAIERGNTVPHLGKLSATNPLAI